MKLRATKLSALASGIMFSAALMLTTNKLPGPPPVEGVPGFKRYAIAAIVFLATVPAFTIGLEVFSRRESPHPSGMLRQAWSRVAVWFVAAIVSTILLAPFSHGS